MENLPGTGPTLRSWSPYLRDEDQCIARILDVVERNSVIEGMPPFDESLRQTIRRELRAILNHGAIEPCGAD